MKKLMAIFLAVLGFTGSLFAGSYGVTVGTNSVCIVSIAKPNAVAWATNTAYTVGQYVTANSRPYLCTVSGTSTNTGSGPANSGTVTDGTVTWRSCLGHARAGVFIVNDSTNTVYVAPGATAVSGSGIRLNASGGGLSLSEPAWQNAIYAISDVAGCNVTVFEW